MKPPIEVLRVPVALVEQLHLEARRCYPREACGFVLGERAGAEASADSLVPAENRARRPDRFLIDAHDVFGAMQAGREGGRELLGVYHSHPDRRPEPSATDRADAWYEWLYVIVSVTRPSPPAPTPSFGSPGIEDPELSAAMACWRWDGDRFAGVAVRPAHEAPESRR